jgi:hypothetical protein
MPPLLQTAKSNALTTPSWQVPLAAPAPAAPAQSVTPGQVYWVGSDGNVWLKAADGSTKNVGAPTNLMDNGFDAGLFSAQATRIADPNPGGGATDLRATGTGGTTYKDTTASRNATQTSIDSLGTILNNALTNADTEHTNILDAYNTEDTANLEKYKGDVQKNEISRDSNTQASLLAAARGSRGLYATLASLGALGGTGRTLANRAISTEANADLGAGQKSFDTNVSSLFDARSALDQQEKQRKLDAEQTWKDARNNAEYDNLSENQKLSKEMAGYWSDAGNTGEASNWINRASTFTPQLAAKTKKAPTEYAKKSLAYSAPEMNKYLGGMNSTAVNVASGNPINGAIYTSTKKRDELA